MSFLLPFFTLFKTSKKHYGCFTSLAISFQIVVHIKLSLFEVSSGFMNYMVGSFVTYEASAGKCFHPDSKSIAHKSFVKTLPST